MDAFERLLQELTPDPVDRALVQIEADTAPAETRALGLIDERLGGGRVAVRGGSGN